MAQAINNNGLYNFILQPYTPRDFAEGWTNTFTDEMSATDIIKIASIHVDEHVTVDVEMCEPYLEGRTLKEQKLKEYQESLTVSD